MGSLGSRIRAFRLWSGGRLPALWPPLSENAWATEFEKYKASSEYELVNKGMTLDEFKRIYWWEWAHRLLGRLLPLLFFQFRGLD